MPQYVDKVQVKRFTLGESCIREMHEKLDSLLRAWRDDQQLMQLQTIKQMGENVHVVQGCNPEIHSNPTDASLETLMARLKPYIKQTWNHEETLQTRT